MLGKYRRSLVFASRIFFLSAACLVVAAVWWATPVLAQSAGSDAALPGQSSTPLIAVTAALSLMTSAVGLVVRAMVKGDIVPKSAAAREDKLIETNATLADMVRQHQTMIAEAARREDAMWNYLLTGARPHQRPEVGE